MHFVTVESCIRVGGPIFHGRTNFPQRNGGNLVRGTNFFRGPKLSWQSCLVSLAKDINALEKVQRFACRVALGTWDLSSDQLLIRTGPLAARRQYLQQCCLFRIVYGYSAFPNGYLIVRTQSTEMTLRSSEHTVLCQPFTRTDHFFIHSSQVPSPIGTHYLLT